MKRGAVCVASILLAGCVAAPPRPSVGFVALQPLPSTVEAISLLGDTLWPPELSPATRARHEERLAQAQRAWEHTPTNADSIIWLGRRQGYLGRFRDAIRTFDLGLELYAADPRFYRHRGHRFITVRRPDLAIADFEQAVKLLHDEPDQVEPDGLPNARGVPLSTLKFNTWYHLGLAHFLRGEWARAARAYAECMAVSKNPDTRVATAHWQYMALRRMGREDQAMKVVAGFEPGMDVVEDSAYYRLVLMYKGTLPADSLIDLTASSPITDVALGYGVGSWLWTSGRRDEAVRVWRRILASGQWPSFGYIAAEADLHRTGERTR